MTNFPFLVILPDQDATPSRTLENAVEAMLVVSDTGPDAIALVQTSLNDNTAAFWGQASAFKMAADTDWHGWSLEVAIYDTVGATLLDEVILADGTGEAHATGVLTSSANYSDTETVTIGTRVYTMQAALTAGDGHVKISTTEALTLANLTHAINGSGGVPGTDYNVTAPDPDVTATNNGVHALTVTAIVVGLAGNSIASTETSATAAWGAATLTGGTDTDTIDGVAAKMVVALNAAGVGIANAAYNSSTNVLTVAGVADAIGDHTIQVWWLAPDFVRKQSLRTAVSTIVDGGIAAAALTVTLGADAEVVPLVAAGLRLVSVDLDEGTGNGAYLVTIQSGTASGFTLDGNIDTVLVYANTVNDAIDAATASFGIAMPAVWAVASCYKVDLTAPAVVAQLARS